MKNQEEKGRRNIRGKSTWGVNFQQIFLDNRTDYCYLELTFFGSLFKK